MVNRMKKDKGRIVTVKIMSSQTGVDGEHHVMDLQETGRLFEREGVLYVLYEESGDAPVKNLLKIEKEPVRIHLRKSGAVSWGITFEEGTKEISDYHTPYGILQMKAETKCVVLQQSEQKISLQLAYTLFIQEEEQAACRLKIEIL